MTTDNRLSVRIAGLGVGRSLLVSGYAYGSVRTIVWRVSRVWPKRAYRTELEGRKVRVFRDK